MLYSVGRPRSAPGCCLRCADVNRAGSARGLVHMTDIMREIWRQNGVRGLFVGVGPRCTRVAAACAIMISCFEVGKTYFQKYNSRMEAAAQHGGAVGRI